MESNTPKAKSEADILRETLKTWFGTTATPSEELKKAETYRLALVNLLDFIKKLPEDRLGANIKVGPGPDYKTSNSYIRNELIDELTKILE